MKIFYFKTFQITDFLEWSFLQILQYDIFNI